MILLFLLLFNHIVNIKLEEYLVKCSVGYFRKQDSTCEECSSFCLKNFTSVNFLKDCIEPCKNYVNNTVIDYSKSNKPIIEISTTVQNYVNNTNTNNSKTNIKLGVIFGVIIVIGVIVGIVVFIKFIIYKKRKCGKFSPRSCGLLNKINSPHLSNSNNNTHPVSMNDTSYMIETKYENNRSNDIESGKSGKFSPLNKNNSPHLSNSNNNTHPVSMNGISDMIETKYENNRSNDIESRKCGKFSPRSCGLLNKINSPHLSNSNNNTHPVSMNDTSCSLILKLSTLIEYSLFQDMIETKYENNRSNDIESVISSRSLDRLNENNECGKEDQSTGFNSSLHVNSTNNIDIADSDSMNNVPENIEKNGRTIEDNSSNDIESGIFIL